MPEDKILTPFRAIRANCLICSGGSSNEVKLCPIKDCPLYPYRFGKRPQTAIKHFEKLEARKLSQMAEEKTEASAERPQTAKREEE